MAMNVPRSTFLIALTVARAMRHGRKMHKRKQRTQISRPRLRKRRPINTSISVPS
jgi:hypothetical protein